MPEEVLTLVKIPITEIEEWIRAKHVLPKFLTNFSIEGNALVLYFRKEPDSEKQSDFPKATNLVSRRRRAHRRRNRMKTRGWQVVARMTNSKGQKCAIYKPFVEALQDRTLNPEEQRKLVEKILRSNRNRPSETSIQYFLENTIEYLRNQESLSMPQESKTGSGNSGLSSV
jgi:hypothetical protein